MANNNQIEEETIIEEEVSPLGTSIATATAGAFANEPITTEQLEPTPQIDVTQPDTTGITTDISDLAPEVTEIPETPQIDEVDDFATRFEEIGMRLADRPTFEAEKRREIGVPELRTTEEDLVSQIKGFQIQSANLAQEKALAEERIQQESIGRGRTVGGIRPLTSSVQRNITLRQADITSQALTVSATLNAIQGRLVTARRQVEEAVEAKFGSLLAEKDAIIENVNFLQKSGILTREENKRAEAVKARQAQEKAEIDGRKATQKAISDIALEAAGRTNAEGGRPSATLLDNILKAENPVEATRIINESGFGEVAEAPDFRFVPQTKTQQGGVFDPSTGTFIPLGVTPGTVAEGVLTNAQKRSLEQADTAMINIDNIIGTKDTEGLLETGLAQNAITRVVQSKIPGTKSFDLDKSLDTVRALIGFDALEKMRLASPTGGALGNVSEKEIGFLQSVEGSLNIGQSTEQLKRNLNRIRLSFAKVEFIIESTAEGFSEAEIQNFLNTRFPK